MRAFRKSAVGRRLTLVLALTVVSALIAAGLGLASCDAHPARRATGHELAASTKSVGHDCASFPAVGGRHDDSRSLTGLRAAPHIMVAGVGWQAGGTLAGYSRDLPVRAFCRASRVEETNLRLLPMAPFHPIIRSGVAGAVISLVSGMKPWDDRLWRTALAILAGMLAAAVAAWLYFRRLQHLASNRILDLIQTIEVATGGTKSSHLAERGGDELGLLRNSIRNLLSQLEERDVQLRRQREELNSQVAARTAELEVQNTQLTLAKKDAEQACRAQSEFLANMSHEIRTPMNAIMGMAELALDCGNEPARREYLGLVKNSAESLLTIINDILDVSKIEAGKLDIDETEFSLRACLGEALKTLALRAHQKDLELALRVQPDLPDSFLGDPLRLRQILFNLVGNAIKFTDKGEVSINVASESSADDGAVLHFTVTDTGIGIPPEKVRIIFEAFTQADHSTPTRYGGTGLGLTISSRLVALMGGELWVESEVGTGSSFHFTLKLLRGKPAAGNEDEEIPAVLRDVPVLVVDDNGTNRMILNELLSHWGMRPTLAENGKQGIEILERAGAAGPTFPLILFDCHLPDMDGPVFSQRIKSNPHLTNVIVPMLAPGSQWDDGTRCNNLLISTCLAKPILPSELLEAVLIGLGHKVKTTVEVPAPATRGSLNEDRRPLCILLAEDNPINQTVAVRLLQKMGHSVTVVANGRDAVRKLEEQEFDLILMDVQMPEMDGLEATRVIRAKEVVTHERIPIIAMTAHAMKGDRERCLSAGMDSYLVKPIRPVELMVEIEPYTSCPKPEKVPPLPEGNCIDWPAAWAYCDNDRDLMSELVHLFLHDLPQQMTAMQKALAGNQSYDLERMARRLKVSVGNFAAMPAFDAAFRLENVARQGDLDQASKAVTVLEHEIQRLRGALQEWECGLPANGGADLHSPPPHHDSSDATLNSVCG